jgi:hypothetical protein
LSDSKIAIRYHVAIDRPPKEDEFHKWAVLKWETQEVSGRKIKRPTVIKQASKVDIGDTVLFIITPMDWRTELYCQYVSDRKSNLKYYSKELEEEWPKMYDMEKGEYYSTNPDALTYFFDMIDPDALTNV